MPPRVSTMHEMAAALIEARAFIAVWAEPGPGQMFAARDKLYVIDKALANYKREPGTKKRKVKT